MGKEADASSLYPSHTLSFHLLCPARPEQRSPAEGKVKDRSYQVCPHTPFQGALLTAIILRACVGLTCESSVLSSLRKVPIIFFVFVTYSQSMEGL